MLDRYQAIDPARLNLGPNVRVLDVGCGSGRHLLELSRLPGKFIGVDMDREDLRRFKYILVMTERERPIVASIDMIVGLGEQLPFPDGRFDVVICTETLEHVDDDRIVLSDLVRVLRPGGTLVVSVPDEYAERLLWRFSPRYRTHPGGHVRIYRRKQMEKLLRDGGAEPFAVEFRHSLESFRWLVHSVVDKEWGEPGKITKGIRWVLDKPSHRNWRVLSWCDWLGNRLLPKSVVVYGRKPEQAAT